MPAALSQSTRRTRSSSRKRSEACEPPAVHVVAPVGRDANLVKRLLHEAGMNCRTYVDAQALPDALPEEAGVLLVTQEALQKQHRAPLLRLLREQPPWSKRPLVACLSPDRRSEARREAVESMYPGGPVMVLERPLRASSLRAVVQGALQLRNEQQHAADLMDELRETNDALEERVTARTKQVRALAEALTVAEQRERKHLSHVLHDHLQQLLYGMRARTQLLRNTPPEDRDSDVLGQIDDILGDSIRLTRTLTAELNPPVLETDGFANVLDWLARHMEERHGLHVAFTDETDTAFSLRDELRVLLFRLTRELLFNVVKHTETDQADLVLATPASDNLTVTVRDEGRGFHPAGLPDAGQAESGLGLFSVRERIKLFGGEMSLDAAPGEGTRVTLSVPLPEE